MDRFEPGDRALLTDGKGRKYLVTLRAGGQFHFHRGIVEHDAIIGRHDGQIVTSTGNERLSVLKPTYSDFVLKMPRGAQVVYPKDAATVVVQGDIYPGAIVVEAGIGSGALTIALLRAVGERGRVIAYEMREDFAQTARANIESFMGKTENLEVRMGSIYEPIDVTDADRMVLDLSEPWRALPQAARALRAGGVLICYLPTVLQVHELSEILRQDPEWTDPLTIETLLRTWHIEGQSARPDHRMVGHTGFVTIARRVVS